MLSHKQPSFYPLLILFALALTSFAVQPSITLNGANSQPSTYVINDVSVDDGSYFIQPEFINESYLFLPISQVSFSTAHMFTTENFEFHQVHVGAKYHYYQTDKHVIMGKMGDSGLKFVNYAEISVPDIIFSQQKCTHLAVDPREIYSISACTDTSDNSIYLIMVSYVSSRPTYVQSLKTSIKEVAQMKLVGKFLYVLDHDETTNTNNKLHIYKVNIGGTTTAKQAMDIVGYIDQAPFGADKLDIGSFDVAVFETAQKVFMADKNFGLRTIDINTEDIKLYNAFSNPIANNIVSVAIHTCDAKSCYLVVSSKDSSIGYASWGRNGQASAFDFISTFSLPKHVTINEKLTIKDNFLAVMSQADEGNRLHFFSIPTGRFASSIAPIGAVSYRPVSSYQNDFFIDCVDQQDDSCKLYVPNPVNHLEEYILRPHFAVKVQPHELKSTYFNLVPRFNPSSPTKKVMINKPGQAQSPMAAVAPQPNVAPEPVVENVSEQEAYMAIIEQFRPTSIPVFPVAVNKYMQQQLNAAQQTRFYGAPRQIKASSSSSDSDTDEPLTTFHGWFIIFLIILGILAAVAYFTNKPEQKAPASRSANVVEAPSSFAPSYIAPSVVEPLRAPLVESVSEDQVVDVHYRKFEDKFENRYEENFENQGNAEGDLLKVDTGLENDAHEIDLEASK